MKITQAKIQNNLKNKGDLKSRYDLRNHYNLQNEDNLATGNLQIQVELGIGVFRNTVLDFLQLYCFWLSSRYTLAPVFSNWLMT